MRIRTIQMLTYGVICLGALIMLLTGVFFSLSDYVIMFMYLGGAIGGLGMILSMFFSCCPICPNCRDFLVIRRALPIDCPQCKQDRSEGTR